MKKVQILTLAALCLGAMAASQARADERLFGFSYGAEVLPQGGLEYEQWITDYNGHALGFFNRYDISEELEYGLTDKLSASLYIHLNQDYESYRDPASGEVVTESEFRFDGVSTEWKYLLVSPDLHPLGVLLYFEPRYSGDELELEGKIILQSNLTEKWVAVTNFAVEQEYEYSADGTEAHGEPTISAGLAYKVTPEFSVGLEAKEDMIWPDNWTYESTSAFYAGPAFHYNTAKWWATLSIMPQLHGSPESIPGGNLAIDNGDEDFAKVETKLGVGLNF